LRPTITRGIRRAFQGENFQKNLDLVRRVEAIAKKRNALPASSPLAWLLAQGEDIISDTRDPSGENTLKKMPEL